jgi:hypothetical protein
MFRVASRWRHRMMVTLAGVCLCGVRVALIGGLRTWMLRSSATSAQRKSCSAETLLAARRLAGAVNAAGNRLPGGASCLCRAITFRMLLRPTDCPSRLSIGVARGSSNSLRAHAWVDVDGEVLIGGPVRHVEDFQRLGVWE